MPALPQFFDMAPLLQPPGGHAQPAPLTLGPNWQPNDTRLLFLSASGQHDKGATSSMMPMGEDPPTGFSSAYTMAPGQLTEGVYYKTIATGDVDSSVRWPKPKSGWRHFVWATLTARGLDPTIAPVGGHLAVTHVAGSGVATVSSVTVPAAGYMIFCLGTVPDPGSGGVWPAWSVAMNVPTGWTHMVATEKSGITFDQWDTNPNIMVIGKAYASAGSTGSVVVPVGLGGPAFAGLYCFVRAAPDASSTGGTASSASTATAGSSSSGISPTSVSGPALSKSTATPGYNPLYGQRIDLEKVLDGSPVTASAVRWSVTVPAGATFTVETSINNGASWDVATNNRPIPRLRERDTTTRSVWSRITMSRPNTGIGLPDLASIEFDISVDRGVDEVVPCGHGVIERVTTKATGGTGGGGGSGGGGGVVARGGGSVGGAANIRIHAADLASLIRLAKWEQPFTLGAGIAVEDAIKAMVLDRLPGHTAFRLCSTGAVIESLLVFGVDQGGDPLDDIRGVAQARGFECFFDSAGVFVLQPIPDPRVAVPVREFDQSVDPVITEVQQELDLSKIFNFVIVKGDSTSSKNAFNAFAINNDPNLRTSVQNIGKRVERLTFQLNTQDKCQLAADTTLLNSLGLSDTVTVTIPPDPSLECGDAIRIVEAITGVSAIYVTQQIPHLPMSPVEGQQLVCFRQTSS